MTRAASTERHTIHEVARITGLEESRLRFLEAEYRDCFEAAGIDLAGRRFDGRRVAMLLKIHALTGRHDTPQAVRRELRQWAGAPGRTARVAAVTSGKGGVGKTTVSLNLAAAMAQRGVRTVLVDADLGLANAHVLAGLKPRHTIVDVVDGRTDIEEALTDGPWGLRVLCGGSGVARLADLDRRLADWLARELRRLAAGFDVMLLDTGAGISSQVMYFLRMADDIVVVATPAMAATLDAYGVLKVVWHARFPGRIHILVNQAAGEDEAATVFEKIGTCAQRFLGFTPAYLGHLVQDPLVEESNRQRRLLIEAFPESANAPLLGGAASLLIPPEATRGRPPPAEVQQVFIEEEMGAPSWVR